MQVTSRLSLRVSWLALFLLCSFLNPGDSSGYQLICFVSFFGLFLSRLSWDQRTVNDAINTFMVSFPMVVQSIDPLLTWSEQMPLSPNSRATELSTFPGGEPEYVTGECGKRAFPLACRLSYVCVSYLCHLRYLSQCHCSSTGYFLNSAIANKNEHR